MATKRQVISMAKAMGLPQKALSPQDRQKLTAALSQWAQSAAQGSRSKDTRYAQGVCRNIAIEVSMLHRVVEDKLWLASLDQLLTWVRRGADNPDQAVEMCQRAARQIATMRSGLMKS